MFLPGETIKYTFKVRVTLLHVLLVDIRGVEVSESWLSCTVSP